MFKVYNKNTRATSVTHYFLCQGRRRPLNREGGVGKLMGALHDGGQNVFKSLTRLSILSESKPFCTIYVTSYNVLITFWYCSCSMSNFFFLSILFYFFLSIFLFFLSRKTLNVLVNSCLEIFSGLLILLISS